MNNLKDNDQLKRINYARHYKMPWEVIKQELENFDALVADKELNESNYNKYRRGWLLRAELAYMVREARS